VDSKAECDQLNLAQETKTKKRRCPITLVQYRFKVCEGRPVGIRRLWRKGFVIEISFQSGVKDWGVIDDESEGGDCDEVICTG